MPDTESGLRELLEVLTTALVIIEAQTHGPLGDGYNVIRAIRDTAREAIRRAEGLV